MVPKKAAIALLVVLSILVFIMQGSRFINAATQVGFVLDLDGLGFEYEEQAFNISNTSIKIDFPNGGGDDIFWISIPRNSTVTKAEMNVTGRIITIYSSLIKTLNVAPLGMVIGNVTDWPGSEIITGTSGFDGEISIAYGTNGSIILDHYLSTDPINSIAVGNVTSDPGDEIVAGSNDNKVYVIEVDSGATQAWNYSTSGDVKSVGVDDVFGVGEDKVIAGGGSNLYLLNPDGSLNWSTSVGDINDIAPGNVTSDQGLEIVVVNGTGISAVNASGSIVWYSDLCSANTVDLMNVTSDPGNEVAVGCSNNKVYLLNTSDSGAQTVWEFDTGGPVISVAIGDATSDLGNEVVVGSDDGKIYTINNSGDLIWDYFTASQVKSVALGNITVAEGNETVAGAVDGNIYTFNFDYFPSNVTLDVGSNGTSDWNFDGYFRTTQRVTGLEASFQYHLDNNCSASLCNVSISYHSDSEGRLNVSAINVTYTYNVSDSVGYAVIPSTWSRTSIIQVNESIGNEVKNVSFQAFPENDVFVTHIKMPVSSESCDFNGTAYQNQTIGQDNACNVPDFWINISQLPSDFHFWDEGMSSAIPVSGNESGYAFTNGTDNNFGYKQIWTWNDTATVFYNISVNTTVNDPSIVGSLYLNVTWAGQECNLTPQLDEPTCDSASPSYSQVDCGVDSFQICKKGSLFRWVQPYSDSAALYRAGGSTNLQPALSNLNVTLNQSVWGDWFNYSVFVNDTDGDSVNVTLYYWLEHLGTEFSGGTVNVTGQATAWFNISSDSNWVGVNYYWFQYQDFNSSGDPLHSAQNTSIVWGPNARKHNTGVVHAQGNESAVNRTESVELAVRINDTENSTWVGSGVACVIWVTYNGSGFDSGNYTTTNSSGHCSIQFTPDGNYSTGNNTWKAGVLDDTYYNDSNSSEFVLTVNGRVNISLIQPQQGGIFYKNLSNTLEAWLVDQYGFAVNQSGFNCSFWFNYSYLNSSDTIADGSCNISWTPPCSYARQDYLVNVTLADPTGYYKIQDDMDSRSVALHDKLNIAITEPAEFVTVHKGDSLGFNSSVNDTCLLCQPGEYEVNWSVKWKRMLQVTVFKSPGLDDRGFPVIINSSYLLSRNVDIGDWDINYTRVTLNGVEVSSRINAWNDSLKTEINWSQDYFGNNSELVFLANQSDWENLTYEVSYNRTDGQESFGLIENGGFESGDLGPWSCWSSQCSGTWCQCRVMQEGSETTGSYSLHLSAEEIGGANDIQGARLNLGWPLGKNRIKIRYKPMNEFQAGAWLRLHAGSGSCELSNVTDSWHEDICYNVSFPDATWINISVHDVGDTQNEIGAAHVYVDYVCPANSSGDCDSLHSGYPHGIASQSETGIGFPDNMTWQVPLNESVGLRRVAANASGQFYLPEVENVHVYVYGWGNLSVGNISSSNCTYNDTWVCRQNASMDVFCNVMDANNSLPVEGHTVSFWGDGSFIGSNTTDQTGMALINWINSSDSAGNHTIICNITDDSTSFYNVTSDNSGSISFNISSGNTTGSVDALISPATAADNLTKGYNHTYYLDINVSNTGSSESMYDVVVSISVPAGISATTVSCQPIQPYQSCDQTSILEVTYLAVEGLKDVYVNVTWLNSDTSQSNASNATSISVVNNTVLNIIETDLNYTIPRGGSMDVGNFTVESYGNTDLLSVTFSESGDNASLAGQWITYSPTGIPNILLDASQLVNITIDVPENASEGIYLFNITADATGSSCTPSTECQDNLTFLLNVTVPDWGVAETSLNKTIGITPVNGSIGRIEVTNNKGVLYEFNATLDSGANGSGIITVPTGDFNVSAYSIYYLDVYHNTSVEYSPGLLLMNITITNKGSAVPQFTNVSIALNVINFSLSILAPNETNPVTDVLAGDLLNVTANATLSGSPVDQNITWWISIGSQACSAVQGTYNASDQLWYLNCSAPGITGNVINNSINVTAYYSTEDVALSVTESNAVYYRDITPPVIEDIWLTGTGVDSEGNVDNTSSPTRIIVWASLSDNLGVNSSWAMLYHQNVHQANYSLYQDSGNWTFNFTSPVAVGDYRAIIYANDSAGNENDTSTYVMGYFDVYLPIDLSGTVVNKDGTPLEANFTLYRNYTQWDIHRFNTNSSGNYSHTIHKRFYDLKVEFSGQEVKFFEFDSNDSAVDQHGIADPDNLTDPLALDYYTSENITQIGVTLPDGAENPIMVFAIEHNMTLLNSSVDFNLYYGQALQDFYDYIGGSIITESDLGVYKCSNWSISARSCIGSFQNESIIPSVDVAGDRISFTASGTSAFAIAEWEGVDQNGGNGDQDPGNNNGGGGGGGGRSSSSSGTGTSVLPFTVTTSIGNILISPGENKTYLFSVKNKGASNATVTLDVQGLEEFIFPEKTELDIDSNGTEVIAGTYTGSIFVTSGSKTQEIPVTMTVTVEAKDLVSLAIDILTPNVNPGGKLRFNVDIRNLALQPGFNVSLSYVIKESENERVVSQSEEVIILEDSVLFSKYMDIGADNAIGQYYLEVWALFGEGKSVNEVAVFNLVEPYWSSWEGRVILMVLFAIGIVVMGFYVWKRYKEWRLEKSRYIFPLDYKKIPKGGGESFWLGRVAETDKHAWYRPSDLTTHAIVAGATGSGKSVTASVFVEEALEKNIPVIVFDPTAQWTGFVKALEDQNLKKYYPAFSMDPKMARPFKGMIFEVTDPHELLFDIKQNFQKFLSPGEVTVFTMDKLKPGQYDEAVGIIIDAIFGISWEESAELKVIVVFDEVHRLLEKYGGKGGYVSLEKAAREFRKWGIGMIMCSQVLADFKEAIAGNVLTEIQLNTKSITDIQKVETKYGKEYSAKISRQGVGVGMIQNPKYNDGKPYFVHFRPTWHNPHKISNKEMEIYKEFAKRLEVIDARIEKLKKAGKDTFDIELELKLARDKLKQGRFRMAQIYITSLEQHLK
jgi:hypothetical protein